MKGIIKNPKHYLFNKEIRICYLTSEIVMGIDMDTMEPIKMDFDNIELEFEFSWEEEITKNREILNIKKPDEASNYMYYVLINSIKQHLDDEINDIIIIDDDYTVKKEYWIKDISLMVNGIPMKISVSSRKYSNIYDIRVIDIDRLEFMEYCEQEAQRLKNGLLEFTKRLNGLTYTIQSLKS